MVKYISSLCVAFALITISALTNAQVITFSTDLSLGSYGQDVITLQSFLISNGFDIPAISSGVVVKGYFGSQTKIAVARYQSSVSLPNTGYVGPLTRAKLNSTDNRGNSLKLISPKSGEVLQKNSTRIITWAGVAGLQSQTVDIRLKFPEPACLRSNPSCLIAVRAPYIIAQNILIQPSSYTWLVGRVHDYSVSNDSITADDGQYSIEICPTNGSQCSETGYFTISSQISGTNSLQIVSPNGGESLARGQVHEIKWNSPNYIQATTASLRLIQYLGPCNPVCTALYPSTYTVASSVPINQNYFNWSIGWPEPAPCPQGFVCFPLHIPDGKYIIEICESNTSNCDSSDAPITIFTAPQIKVSVTSPKEQEIWQANSNQYITWSVQSNTDSNPKVDIHIGKLVSPTCITLGGVICNPEFQMSYLLDRNIPGSSYYWIVGTDINNGVIPPDTYAIRVCLVGSTINCGNSNSFTLSGYATTRQNCPAGFICTKNQ